jgi:hypothetical protein
MHLSTIAVAGSESCFVDAKKGSEVYVPSPRFYSPYAGFARFTTHESLKIPRRSRLKQVTPIEKIKTEAGNTHREDQD